MEKNLKKNVYIYTWLPLGSGGKEVTCSGSGGKQFACSAGDTGDAGSIPRSERSPGRVHGNPPQYSWPGKSHGPKSLLGSSPKGSKESDMTDWLSTHTPETQVHLKHNIASQLYSIRKNSKKYFFHLSTLHLDWGYMRCHLHCREELPWVWHPVGRGWRGEDFQSLTDREQPCSQSPLKKSTFSPNAVSVLLMGIFKLWIMMVSLQAIELWQSVAWVKLGAWWSLFSSLTSSPVLA